MEKLLPRSRLLAPRDVAPLLVEEKGKQDSSTKAQPPIYNSAVTENTGTRQQQQHSDAAEERVVDTVSETLHSTAEEYTLVASGCSGERLFVFRDPPETCGNVGAVKRKRKRNFLNLKKGSVAPTNQP